jgi:hypothetical protein
MKTIAAVIVALLLGLSFAAGVKHGRGELTPAVEAKLRAAKDWFVSKLPARVQGWLNK